MPGNLIPKEEELHAVQKNNGTFTLVCKGEASAALIIWFLSSSCISNGTDDFCFRRSVSSAIIVTGTAALLETLRLCKLAVPWGCC
jgi:hypothetical protein